MKYLSYLLLLVLCACNPIELTRVAKIGDTTIENPTATSARFTGQIIDLGGTTIQYGHSWATHTAPTTDDNKSEKGNNPAKGAFQTDAAGLLPDTKYYVRAYLKTEGATLYGTETNFNTQSGSTNKSLAVYVDSFENIGASASDAKGSVSNIGSNTILKYGHCWSATNATPTPTDSKDEKTGVPNGQFASQLRSLNPDTPYNVRAYVVLSDNSIKYSDVKTFRTTPN